MANWKFDFRSRVFATPSAATVVLDGTEIFSGQVGAGQPLDTELSLTSEELETGGTFPVTISVTSGVLTIGDVKLYGHDAAGAPGSVTLLLDDDVRSSILVNGLAPEWPATPVDPMPGGTPENPDWTGWFFEVSAGESITFNVAAS